MGFTTEATGITEERQRKNSGPTNKDASSLPAETEVLFSVPSVVNLFFVALEEVGS